jgi:hypothetical protein
LAGVNLGENAMSRLHILGCLAAILFSCDAASACGWGTRTYDKTVLGIEVEAQIDMTSAEKICGVVIPLSGNGTISAQPTHGTARFTNPNFIYVPTPGYVGEDTFYANGSRGPDRVSITVYVTIKR